MIDSKCFLTIKSFLILGYYMDGQNPVNEFFGLGGLDRGN